MFNAICRRLVGRFNFFTVLGIPSALGAAMSSIVLAERAVYHYAHGLSTIVSNFETFNLSKWIMMEESIKTNLLHLQAFQVSLLRGDFYILKILRNSRLAITLAFMILNAILMHGLRENQTSRFYWITQPLKPKIDFHEFYEASPIMDQISEIVRSQIKCCAHADNCDSFIYEVW